MKIELKRIEFSERLSQETNAFSADLYINGRKVGEASNQGRGGPTDYGSYDEEGRALIKEAEAYCKTLPPHTFKMNGETHSIEMDLEMYIDNLLTDYLEQKELQKFRRAMEKAMIKSFVIGITDKSYDKWTFKVPLAQFMSSPNKPEVMANLIKQYVIPKLVDGNILLNTNIPESFLKLAGLKEGQYVPFKEVKPEANKKQSPKKSKRI